MYGVIITLSIFIAATFVDRIVQKSEISKRKSEKAKESNNQISVIRSRFSEHLWGSLFWALLLGIIGARVYHVIDLWDYYSQNPKLILAVWTGGMGIFGGLLGGLLGYYLYLKQRKLKVWQWLDFAALGIPLAQAIGRWGNFFNQELYGLPTDLPWAIFIKPENRLFPVKAFETFHPLFLYESLGCLIVWGILVFIYKNPNYEVSIMKYERKIGYKIGDLFALYMIGYGILRFVLEPMRIVSWEVGGFKVAQLFSLGFVLIGIYLLRGRKGNVS